MRTIGFRGRAGAPAAPRRGRRRTPLRELLLRHLRAAGGREIATEMMRHFVTGRPRAAVEAELEALHAAGLVGRREATEPIWRGRTDLMHRVYWRLADAPAREG